MSLLLTAALARSQAQCQDLINDHCWCYNCPDTIFCVAPASGSAGFSSPSRKGRCWEIVTYLWTSGCSTTSHAPPPPPVSLLKLHPDWGGVCPLCGLGGSPDVFKPTAVDPRPVWAGTWGPVLPNDTSGDVCWIRVGGCWVLSYLGRPRVLLQP